MADIHETAYPRCKSSFTQKELTEVFQLSAEELSLLKRKTKTTNVISRLGFAIVLKYYQYLGRPINPKDTSCVRVKEYIAKQLSIDPETDLLSYANRTFENHKKIIRDFLNISIDKKQRRNVMKQVALEAAETKENLADIINCVIEEVFHQRFELPGYQKLVRLSRAARTVVNNRNYHKISASLSKAQKKYIDKIISLNADKAPDEWAWIALKQEPRSPTQNNIKQFSWIR